MVILGVASGGSSDTSPLIHWSSEYSTHVTVMDDVDGFGVSHARFDTFPVG